MRRTILHSPLTGYALAGLLLASGAGLCAQQGYISTGTSNPPAEEINVLPSTETTNDLHIVIQPKSSPARRMDTDTEPILPSAELPTPVPMSTIHSNRVPDNTDPDGDIVHLSVRSDSHPIETPLTARSPSSDPDGDIVQPRTAEPGAISAGTTIRVRLMDRLSTATSEKGETFHSKVASDVYSGDEILIPVGSEIDGQVVKVSSGTRLGSSGFMRLRPETLILPNGSSYQFRSDVTGTPGSKTRMGAEGTIKAGSRTERDTVEYGGTVGAGVLTGAIIAGPVGALTGGVIGAGVVTTHLLVSHPQATLESGTVLLITLTDPLRINSVEAIQN